MPSRQVRAWVKVGAPGWGVVADAGGDHRGAILVIIRCIARVGTPVRATATRPPPTPPSKNGVA